MGLFAVKFMQNDILQKITEASLKYIYISLRAMKLTDENK